MARDPLDIIEQAESKGKNVPNYKYGPGFTASGYYQITNPTWRRWAKSAGIDISQYPRAMDAPRDVQRSVAEHGFKTEGFRPWEAVKQLAGQEAKYGSPARPAPAQTARKDGAPGPKDAEIPTLPQNVDKGTLAFSPFEKLATEQKEQMKTIDNTQQAAMAQLNQAPPLAPVPTPMVQQPMTPPSAADAEQFAALMIPRIRRGLLADPSNYGILG